MFDHKEKKQRKLRERLLSALFSMILAGIVAVYYDTVTVAFGKVLTVARFVSLCLILFALILLVPRFDWKKKGKLAGVMAAVAVTPVLLGLLCWYQVSQSAIYHGVDEGKASLFADQKVMLLVPHQDDDINVLGGVMEEYVKYGSEVYVVFSTNGDYYGLGELRIREAIAAMNVVGIPEDHVIFLGYGDQWDAAGPHLYNAEPGAVMTSVIGYTKTYGTADHPSYQNGSDYTIENFRADIEGVILEHRPDVLYCVDYDYNIDHRALTLSFDKVMGKILKEHQDYRPLVLKGYAYNTAWEAVDDFYAENLLATRNAFEEPYESVPQIYRWEDRVRLPVSGAFLSRSAVSTSQYRALSMYASQRAKLHSIRIINSDKVFWQRPVESLVLTAQVEGTSGNTEFLNDFLLLESNDLINEGDAPYDGVWTPDDGQKQAKITFSKPEDLEMIILYDDPNPDENVINAVITFDDGTILETGPLAPRGAATKIPVQKKAVSDFTVALTEMEGEAGLAEIEAYGEQPDTGLSFVKLMDKAGNFAYDYWIDPSGVQTFLLHTDGAADAARYAVSCSNTACSAVLEGTNVLVSCPTGESCIITVTDEDGVYSDSVYIRNPNKLERTWKRFWLRAEEKILILCRERVIDRKLIVWRIFTKVPIILERVFG